MPFLVPLLDVAFIGLVGFDPGHVDRQILRAEPRLVVKHVKTAQLAAIAKRDDNAAETVAALGVDGVVTGEIVGDAKHRSLRLVVYRGTGAMASLSETELTGKKLGKDDVEVLQSNLSDELGDLLAHAAKAPAKTKDAGPSKAMAESDPFADAFEDKPAKRVAKAEAPAKVAKAKPSKPAKAEQPLEPEQELAATLSEPPTSSPSAPAVGDDKAGAKQVAEATDSDSVSVDEIAAMTGGDGGDAQLSAASSSSGPTGPELHLAATAGFGVIGRNFAPGPSTLVGYNSSPVGAAHVDGAIEPFAHAHLEVSLDTSLGMDTTVNATSMATTMSRWEGDASYSISLGKLSIAPEVGIGIRSFSINASGTADRTPNQEYTYVIAGIGAAYPITDKITARALVAFEPVIAGSDPLAMELGSATRWAFDAGGSIDIRATEHLFIRAIADYQSFQWSWSMAGSQGAGGATDSYPTAMVALAAHY